MLVLKEIPDIDCAVCLYVVLAQAAVLLSRRRRYFMRRRFQLFDPAPGS